MRQRFALPDFQAMELYFSVLESGPKRITFKSESEALAFRQGLYIARNAYRRLWEASLKRSNLNFPLQHISVRCPPGQTTVTIEPSFSWELYPINADGSPAPVINMKPDYVREFKLFGEIYNDASMKLSAPPPKPIIRYKYKNRREKQQPRRESDQAWAAEQLAVSGIVEAILAPKDPAELAKLREADRAATTSTAPPSPKAENLDL